MVELLMKSLLSLPILLSPPGPKYSFVFITSLDDIFVFVSVFITSLSVKQHDLKF